jgi:hypothetical protein
MDEVTNPGDEPEVADVSEEVTEQPAEDSSEYEQEFDEDGNPVEPEPDDEQPADDDDEEIEINGKRYKVPKEAALRQADYTRKTQEIAEQRRQYEAAIERVSQVSEAETQALYQVAQIDAQLAQYQNVDWNAWDQADPIAAVRARQELSELQRLREDAAYQHANARTQAAQLAQQETARRLEEGQKVLAERIPGWGADKAIAIRSFAKEAYALSDEQIATITDPVEVMVLHDAMLWRQSQKKAATATKVVKQQAIKPAPTVTGGKKVSLTPNSKMSDAEWYAARERQIAQRNKR